MKPTEEFWSRFLKLRADLFEEIKNRLSEDGHCKSYEGALSIGFPDYFQSQPDSTRHENGDCFSIHLDCYVVGPSRHYDWTGHTLELALEKAEKDIRSWIKNT